MSWAFVLRFPEMEMFRSCRRAWDFGAQVRRNQVPRIPPSDLDLETAVCVGLAAYYLPATDDWSRSIVRPLASKAFHRAMSEQRKVVELSGPLTAEQDREWHERGLLGDLLLGRYFDWADVVDDFDSLFSDEPIWSSVADPDRPGRDMGTPEGRPVRYLARIDQLISDVDDDHWIVDNRIAWHRWADDDDLIDDDESLYALWAVETAYPQLRLSGTVHNELMVHPDDMERTADASGHPPAGSSEGSGDRPDRRDMSTVRHVSLRRSPATPVSPPGGVGPDRDRVIERTGNEHVRRTVIRRARSRVAEAGRRLADHAAQASNPNVDVSPDPSPERCARCAYLAPCDAMNEGRDADTVLAARYRVRRDDELDEERLRSGLRPGQRGGFRGTSLSESSDR